MSVLVSRYYSLLKRGYTQPLMFEPGTDFVYGAGM